MRDRTGWRSLFAWALALGLAALTVIAAASIGVFVLPVAAVAFVLVARWNHVWPESVLGGFLGVGAGCFFVAYRNRAYATCPPAGMPITLNVGERLTCGGFDPTPWLAIGALLVLVGLVTYVAYSYRDPRSAS